MTRTSPDATPALAESSPATEAPAKLRRRDRIEVRESGVHGRGVYAVVAIARGKKIIEYKGEHITWKEALRRHPQAARSVLNYGLPMLSGQFTSSIQRVSMEQALKNAILQFEPRILPRTLEVEIVMEGSSLDSHNCISLLVRGSLWAQPVPLEFLMRSRVDLEEGRIAIDDLSNPAR